MAKDTIESLKMKRDEAASLLKKKQGEIEKKYKEVFEINSFFLPGNIDYDNIRIRIKIIEYLLENNIDKEEKSMKMREILAAINEPVWKTHMFNMAYSKLNPAAGKNRALSAGNKGFFIENIGIAKKWVEIAKEIANFS